MGIARELLIAAVVYRLCRPAELEFQTPTDGPRTRPGKPDK